MKSVKYREGIQNAVVCTAYADTVTAIYSGGFGFFVLDNY